MGCQLNNEVIWEGHRISHEISDKHACAKTLQTSMDVHVQASVANSQLGNRTFGKKFTLVNQDEVLSLLVGMIQETHSHYIIICMIQHG